MVGDDLISENKRLESELVGVEGVVGVGADLSRGKIIVYIESEDVANRLVIKSIYPVEFRVVGKVKSL